MSSILKQLQKLRSLYRHAGIRAAVGQYEVFSTAPANLRIWKQVPTLEEALDLAQQLVTQHEGSILNVWHHDEGHLYQIENRGGRLQELRNVPPTPPSKPEKVQKRRPWDEEMADYWQSTAATKKKKRPYEPPKMYVSSYIPKALVDGKVYTIMADVGFTSFVPPYSEEGVEEPLPTWVLDHIREENFQTLPEVTDEDLVKVHG